MDKPREQADAVERVELCLSFVLRLTLALAFVGAILRGQWSVLFPSGIALALTFFPAVVQKRIRLSLPTEFEFLFVIFVYAAVFLGEAHDFYNRYWWWDVMLHGISGANLGLMGFVILFALSSGDKIKASAFLIAVFSFTFSLALGALWEIYEYGMDSFFGLNMQKSGLVDTMWDLIVDSLGALWASALGFFYIKRNKGYVVRRLIEKLAQANRGGLGLPEPPLPFTSDT